MDPNIIFIFGAISFMILVGGISFTLKEIRLKSFRTSDFFFFASALVAFLLANYLWFNDFQDYGIFVGIWVPSNLILGLYFRTMSSK